MSAKNTALIAFAKATANWGIISYFGIWNAVTGGTFIAYDPVTTPKPVEVDDTVRWEPETLVVTTD
jgi:hypothetical protein